MKHRISCLPVRHAARSAALIAAALLGLITAQPAARAASLFGRPGDEKEMQIELQDAIGNRPAQLLITVKAVRIDPMTDDMTVVHQGNAAATIRTQTGKNPVEISSGNIVKFWITPGPKTAGLQLIIKVRETNQLPHTIPAHGHAIVAIRKGIKGVVSTPIGVGGH